ncbi:MAG: hypothetical protein JWO24_224 [Rhodospirillales bacterium]|nr:hypothetical protein [Rhodospirillales bacterium]
MKRIARPDLTAAEATRLGEELREARMSMGVSVADMAAQIRIRAVYLQALEEGRLKELPGQAYVVGFLRNYANALGLNTDEVLRRFREVSVPSTKANLVFPEPVPSRGVPAGAVMLAGGVLAVAAYVGWYNFSDGATRMVDAVPPLPPRLEQMAPETPPRAPDMQVATVAPPGATPGATRSVTPAPPPGTPNPAPVVAQAPAAPPGAPNAVAGATPPAAPASGAPRITLRSRADSWIQLRDTRERRVITDRVLRAGETFPVPARVGLVLTLGRADAIELLVDGTAAPALTGIAGIRRDIPMDPDRLRAGPLSAPAAPARPVTPTQ